MFRKILCLLMSLLLLFTMTPSLNAFGAGDIIVFGTNNGSANEIGAINNIKVCSVAPYQMSLLNSITSMSDRLGGKESTDSYINADFYSVDGALFATPSLGANSSKRYRIFSFNTYGAVVEKLKVRYDSTLKPVCADGLSTNSNIRANQWNNIAFVCDTTTRDTFAYINGVLVKSANVDTVVKSMGYTIDGKGDIYNPDGGLVKNVSACFSDIRVDVPKAGTYNFDDLTIALSDTKPSIDAPAVLPAGDGYTIDGDIIKLLADRVQLPAVSGATYLVNGVSGSNTIKAGDVVTLKKTTALGNLFTSYTAIDMSNPLEEVVSCRDGLDGIENYFSTLEKTSFNGEVCSLLKGVTQSDGTKQMFLQYTNSTLEAADIVVSSTFYAVDSISRVQIATSGHKRMGDFTSDKFVKNAWNTITVVTDGETGVNTAYINGNDAGQITQPVEKGIVRMVVNTANSVLEGTDVYVDNFYVLRGSVKMPLVTTSCNLLGSRVITGVYGKTCQQIKDSMVLSGTAMDVEFVYGDTVMAASDKVKNGSKINVYDRGVFVGDYIISFEQPAEKILTSFDGLTNTAIQKLYSTYEVKTENGNQYAFFTGGESTSNDHYFIQYTPSSCDGPMLVSIAVKPFETNGSVFIATRYNNPLSVQVPLSKLDTNEWNTLTLVIDSTTAENKLYVNGEFFGSCTGAITDNVVRFIVKDVNVVGKKIGIDDFCITGGDTVFPPVSSELEINGLTINGYYQMTYKEIVDALVVAKSSMTLSDFTLNGASVNNLSEAQTGAVVTVYDNGAYVASYKLGTAKYTIGESKSYSDGMPSQGYGNGTFTVKQQIASYGSAPVKFMAVLAQYDKNKKLVNVNIENKPVKGKQTMEVSLDIESAEGTSLTYMLVESGNIRPVSKSVAYKPYSTDKAESIIRLYPGYTTKAATFSFDDGIVYDAQTVNVLNKYNAKATFNINGGRILNNFSSSAYGATAEEKIEYIKNMYAGHEIANHTYLHKPCALMEGQTSTDSSGNILTGVSLQDALDDITLNTAYLKEKFGVETRGIAWPNGYPQKRTDYAQLKQGAMEDGHVYARNQENGSFAIPSDWMEWNATAHIKTATSVIDDFVAMENDGEMKICFIWGHSYEFNNPTKYGCGDFEDFDANVAKLAGDNIWLATCGEIYDYVTAMDKLYTTPYGVRNMSDIPLYLNINGTNVEVLPGEEYFVNEAMNDVPSIACWGDSLTYGQGASDISSKSYPAVLSTISGSPVYNMGVPGETTNTIAARQGVYDILISEDFVIPAKSEEVEIKFHSSNGGIVTPRLITAGGWIPCTINGIAGTMRIDVNTNVTPRVLNHAYFTRNVPGKQTAVKSGTALIPYSQTVMADINVIFSGTNGGWTAQNTASKNDEASVRDFAALLRTQAEYSKSGDKYVVIGLTSGNEDSWKLVNNVLAEEFGDNFLDVKGYMLSQQAAEDAGITLTEEDLSYIAQGHIPQSYLTSDKTHFNDTGYWLIAQALNAKLVELGYIN